MADDKRNEIHKQRQLIVEQLEKSKEDREYARKKRERERQARKLRDEAFDLKLHMALDRQHRRKKQSDSTTTSTSAGGSHSNGDCTDDSSDDNPTSRPVTAQRVLQQDTKPSVVVRTSRRPRRMTIGEETGQKEQPISDGSDFVSGYSDDSDHLSQGDDNTGLVAEVQSLREQLTAVNTERNQLLSVSVQGLPSVTLDGRQVASSQPRHRQPFPRSLSTQSTKSEAIQNLFVEIDRLGQESNQLKQKLHSKAVENEDLQNELDKQEAILLALQVENKELQSDLLRLENDNYELLRGLHLQQPVPGAHNPLHGRTMKKLSELEDNLSALQLQLDQVIKDRDHVIKDRDQAIKERDRLMKDRDRVISERDILTREQHHLTIEKDRAVKGRDHVMKERDHVCKEKDQVIRERDQLINEKDKVINERNQVIKVIDKVEKERDQVIKERDEVIKAMDQLVKYRDQLIRENDNVIKEKDQTITEKDQIIKERNEVMKERDFVTSEKDHIIKERDQAIKEKDCVTKKKDQAIKEKDMAVKEKEQVIKEKDLLIKENGRVIIERDQLIKERDQAVKERDIEKDNTILELRDSLDHMMEENTLIKQNLATTIKHNESVEQSLCDAQSINKSHVRKCTELNQALDQVVKERDRMIQQLESCTSQGLLGLHGNIAAMRKVIVKYKEDLLLSAMKLCQEVTARQQEVTLQYQAKMDDLREELADSHHEEVTKLQRSLDENMATLHAAKKDSAMESERAELQCAEAAMWRKQSKQHSEEVDNVNVQLQELREQLQCRATEMNKVKGLLMDTEHQLGCANKELVSKQQHLEEACDKLVSREQQLESVNAKLMCLEQQVELANGESVSKEQQLEAVHKDLAVVQDQLQLTEAKLVSGEQQLGSLSDQLKSCQKELELANSAQLSSEQQLESVKKELVCRDQQLEVANDQLVSKEQQLDLVNSELVAKEQQFEAAEKELISKERLLETANSELVSKEQQFEAADDKLVSKDQQLQATISQVETKRSDEILELKKKLFNSEQDRQQLVSELTTQRMSREGIVPVLEAQVAHLIGERDGLRAQVTSLRDQVQARAVNTQSPSLSHGNNEELQEKIVQLQGLVEARDEVLEELQREMKEKELNNFFVVAKLKSGHIEMGGRLATTQASIVAKDARLREVEERLLTAERQLAANESSVNSPASAEVLRLRSMVSELSFKLSQSQHRCSCLSREVGLLQTSTSQLTGLRDEVFGRLLGEVRRMQLVNLQLLEQKLPSLSGAKQLMESVQEAHMKVKQQSELEDNEQKISSLQHLLEQRNQLLREYESKLAEQDTHIKLLEVEQDRLAHSLSDATPSDLITLHGSRRPNYTLVPRQRSSSGPRNSLQRSQFSINLPGQSDQSIDLLDDSSTDQYTLGPVVVTDDEHGHTSQMEQCRRTHRRVQSCDSSLSACLPSPTISVHMSPPNSDTPGAMPNKARPKSAESSHCQPVKSPVPSCEPPMTPLVVSEGRGSVTPTAENVCMVTKDAQTSPAIVADQRKFKPKRFIGFKSSADSSPGKEKRSLGPVITIAMAAAAAAASVGGEKEWAVKRSESITSTETSFTTGSISPSLDACENFSKIERHESFASYGGGVSRTSSIASRDLLMTPCFKPITAADEESSSEEDWDKPASHHGVLTWQQHNHNQSVATMALEGVSNDNRTGEVQFSIRLLPKSYSSETINLDTMEAASESEEEREQLMNVNELMRRMGRLHCRYSSTGSLVKIYCASDTSLEDIRTLQQ